MQKDWQPTTDERINQPTNQPMERSSSGGSGHLDDPPAAWAVFSGTAFDVCVNGVFERVLHRNFQIKKMLLSLHPDVSELAH